MENRLAKSVTVNEDSEKNIELSFWFNMNDKIGVKVTEVMALYLMAEINCELIRRKKLQKLRVFRAS